MTHRRITETRRGRPHPTIAFLVLAIAALGAQERPAAAELHPVDARVIWSRTGHAYIAAADSIPLAPGDRLTLMRGKKTVASGEVTLVVARDLAALRITSGSLDRSRLDRLRILFDRPPLLPLPLLRVGYPGLGRANLLFACGSPTIVNLGIVLRYNYRDRDDPNGVRLVREGALPDSAPWPDTLLLRPFRDVTDEEIALERGEIDVAFFGPGEASVRLRMDPRWQGRARSARAEGLIVANAPPGQSISSQHSALAALNDRLFRGDLEALGGPPDSASARPSHFEVDSSCIGRAALQRFLDQLTGRTHPEAPAVRIVWLESPAGPPFGATPLFAARPTVAAEPALWPYIEALGPGTLAYLMHCPHLGRAP